MKKLEDYVISIPDFPQEGIIFRDVTGILREADGLQQSIDQLAGMLDGIEFDAVVGPESRGFIFGVPVAYKLKKAFIPIKIQKIFICRRVIIHCVSPTTKKGLSPTG